MITNMLAAAGLATGALLLAAVPASAEPGPLEELSAAAAKMAAGAEANKDEAMQAEWNSAADSLNGTLALQPKAP
ncbi:hypothetical protein ACFQ0X_43195 [Streptomyces rectiviolaceus]|uniref:Uncharacterized protein n=1 Tax=Streptomyces rectiviolaceus TaxID=332591 RepID=A0ABP6MGM3_9ACTN